MINKNEMNNLIKNNTFVIIDIETNGLNYEEDDIIELCAIKMKNGEIIDRYTSLCKPRLPIKKEIEQITGITNDMVKLAPSSKEVVENFLKFVEDAILVGYNISFEVNFINRIANNENYAINNKTIDCLEYVKKLYPNLKNYKMNSSLNAMGFEILDDYSCISSAQAITKMFLKIIDLLS